MSRGREGVSFRASRSEEETNWTHPPSMLDVNGVVRSLLLSLFAEISSSMMLMPFMAVRVTVKVLFAEAEEADQRTNERKQQTRLISKEKTQLTSCSCPSSSLSSTQTSCLLTIPISSPSPARASGSSSTSSGIASRARGGVVDGSSRAFLVYNSGAQR